MEGFVFGLFTGMALMVLFAWIEWLRIEAKIQRAIEILEWMDYVHCDIKLAIRYLKGALR